MQFTFRIDDANFVTFKLKLQDAGDQSFVDGPEVIAAIITEQALPDIEIDQLYSVAGQILDHVTTRVQEPVALKDDWRDAFRRGQ